MHGQFIWYELSTPDVESAKQFYPRFTGWGMQPFDADYTMWTSNGVPIAGLFRLNAEMQQQGVPPNWMAYVESNDVDATVEQAKSLGGSVVAGPDDIPGTGRFAVLRDPQGATFGVYKSSNPSGAWDGTPVVGRFSWHELMTTDYQAAFSFYQSLFGWEKTSDMDMGGGNLYFMFGKGGVAYGGMYNRMPDMGDMPPFWMMYIHVKDVAKAVNQATSGGGRVHRPQMDIPGGSIAILGDPEGAGFALHHANAQPVASAPTAPKKKAARPAKPAATKASKKAAGKAAAKSSTAGKKAAGKKAATKKVTAKKSASKKAATKKTARKKAATKKPAKKSARRPSSARSKPAPRTKARARKR